LRHTRVLTDQHQHLSGGVAVDGARAEKRDEIAP
jgi:hypothetical protein